MQNLDPKSVWIFFFSFLLRGFFIFVFFSFWITPILLGFFVSGSGQLEREDVNFIGFFFSMIGLFLVIFGLYAAFCLFMAKLTYKNWKYELAEGAFKKESGVIWKKYVSVPYERIQNIDINRGIFARMLGLSDLQIQTAGSSAVYYGRGGIAGAGSEGRLPALDKNIAEKLRDELVKRAKDSKKSI